MADPIFGLELHFIKMQLYREGEGKRTTCIYGGCVFEGTHEFTPGIVGLQSDPSVGSFCRFPVFSILLNIETQREGTPLVIIFTTMLITLELAPAQPPYTI